LGIVDKNNRPADHVQVNAIQVILHEQYALKPAVINDIALLKMPNKVTFTGSI